MAIGIHSNIHIQYYLLCKAHVLDGGRNRVSGYNYCNFKRGGRDKKYTSWLGEEGMNIMLYMHVNKCTFSSE